MKFDELMATWKSQDTAPLHDVNQALLHQALQQDEANLQKERRVERWVTYLSSAGVAAAMVIFFAMMVSFRNRPDKVVTLWDYVLPIIGVVAALIAGGLVYAGHRAQARREQRFGGSLRDQINRRLAQLDEAVKGTRRRNLVFVLMGAIYPIALIQLGMRVNDKSFGDVSWVPLAMLILCFLAGARSLRRVVPQAISRKRELEALLKELDGQ